jgi:hypothetical protein
VDAEMAHFEDYELAQSIHGELLELRASEVGHFG